MEEIIKEKIRKMFILIIIQELEAESKRLKLILKENNERLKKTELILKENNERLKKTEKAIQDCEYIKEALDKRKSELNGRNTK